MENFKNLLEQKIQKNKKKVDNIILNKERIKDFEEKFKILKEKLDFFKEENKE